MTLWQFRQMIEEHVTLKAYMTGVIALATAWFVIEAIRGEW